MAKAEQIALFDIPSSEPPQVKFTPQQFKETCRGWEGRFEIYGIKPVGKKGSVYQIRCDIYNPEGKWVEIIEAETKTVESIRDEFYETVDRLAAVSESTLPVIEAIEAVSEFPVREGDWVKLDSAWMDRCLKFAKTKKLYQWKTEADLIHKVQWVAEKGNGFDGLIGIARYGYGIDVPPEFYSVVSELPHQDSLTTAGGLESDRKTVKLSDFEEGSIYWHEEKQNKFKIFKILKSVKKCEGYFAGDPFKVKILLSELSPLSDDSAPAPSPVTELIPVVELPGEIEDCDRWNPEHFGGEVPFAADGTQLTIFYDNSDEPPEPGDFATVEEFNLAWDEWEKQHSSPHQDNSLTVSSDEVDSPVDQDNSLTGINIYKARGSAKGENRYYRYSCKIGKRTKHYHIPGGNIHSVASRSRAEEVAKAVASGLPPAEVVKIIESWKS